MNRFFYLRLARSGIMKNKRLYKPYILTCIGMVMMFYIIVYLSGAPMLETMRGANTMTSVLFFGVIVVGFFALLFLFYTNSFLIRRRHTEFGLYNVLGMNKRNIARILLWETVLVALVSFSVGILAGILFSKLAELLLCFIMSAETGFSMRISTTALGWTAGYFALVFLLLFLFSYAKLRLSKPLELMKSDTVGEKPPKANWVFALLGAVLLIAAYYLAVSIKEPIAALSLFFVAVLMVIAATYLLFIAGSVALCRLLQRNKGYYYKARHFVSVSTMTYRMKRNGAGLASVCILSTMVLVMLSSTSCLFFGGEGSIRSQYPSDIGLCVEFDDAGRCSDEMVARFSQEMDSAGGADIGEGKVFRSYEIAAVADENGTFTPASAFFYASSLDELDNVRFLYVFSLQDYNAMTSEDRTLASDEAMIYSNAEPYPNDRFTTGNGLEFQVAERLESFPPVIFNANMVTSYAIVVDDWASFTAYAFNMENVLVPSFNVCFCADLSHTLSNKEIDGLSSRLGNALRAFAESTSSGNGYSYSENFIWFERDEFMALNGSLFFLGIILSILFIAAAALIIYYKQISEGYEDRARYAIMRNVGMTQKEIRRSINSQVLTVFYAPLLTAGVHLSFAFPLVSRVLRLMGVSEPKLFLLVNIGVFLAFAAFYALIFRLTSNAYYEIVNEKE